ncbi:Ig-like domain-containing protein [Porphyromonas levii]|uniref:Ig-like domain-containing protein n=1 Tax=Porphyromonas levii TaxID=28114 RepID=UPI001BA7CC09|nr:Ig-like domain-containing protein [Porphyromonas levii]
MKKLFTLLLLTFAAVSAVSCGRNDKKPEPAKVALNTTSHSLKVGETLELVATITPASSKEKVSWTTDKKEVATVTSEGKVEAVGEGKAIISAVLSGGNKASCAITVVKKEEPKPTPEPKPKKAKKATITFLKASYSLEIGKTLNLKEEVKITKGDDPTEKLDPSWKSSSPQIATVDKSTGEVKGIELGEATITVTLPNGNSAECKINVTKSQSPKEAKKATITFKKTSYNLEAGKTLNLKEEVKITKGDDPTEKLDPSWESSSPQIATVDKSTGIVSGVKPGEATITATLPNGNKAECKINVTKSQEGGGSDKEIIIKTGSIKVEEGKTAQIEIDYNGVPKDKVKIEFKSVNEEIATVTQDGLVKGESVGETQISVTINGKPKHHGIPVSVYKKSDAKKYTYDLRMVKRDILSGEEKTEILKQKTIEVEYKPHGSASTNKFSIYVDITDTTTGKKTNDLVGAREIVDKTGGIIVNTGFDGSVSYDRTGSFSLRIKLEEYGIEETIKVIVKEKK